MKIIIVNASYCVQLNGDCYSLIYNFEAQPGIKLLEIFGLILIKKSLPSQYLVLLGCHPSMMSQG